MAHGTGRTAAFDDRLGPHSSEHENEYEYEYDASLTSNL